MAASNQAVKSKVENCWLVGKLGLKEQVVDNCCGICGKRASENIVISEAFINGEFYIIKKLTVVRGKAKKNYHCEFLGLTLLAAAMQK